MDLVGKVRIEVLGLSKTVEVAGSRAMRVGVLVVGGVVLVSIRSVLVKKSLDNWYIDLVGLLDILVRFSLDVSVLGLVHGVVHGHWYLSVSDLWHISVRVAWGCIYCGG